MMEFTVAELAAIVDGIVEGAEDRTITGVAPADAAGPGDLTFVQDRRYRDALDGARPAAVLVPIDFETPPGDVTLIRVSNPHVAFAHLLSSFFPPQSVTPGISTSALVHETAELGEEVFVGPSVVIERDAHIGHGTRIDSFTVIGRGARIGRDCLIAHSCSVLEGAVLGERVQIHPGVRVSVDGFGYAPAESGAVKVPQVGRCVIGDDVEIGANSTIDRGALGDTVIGNRTKIDNLVHIGHNVEIGEDCMIVAQVGVAGSVKIGAGTALAGQAGIAGHLEIGSGARIAAQAGVIGNVPAGASYSGYPARPHAESMRASAALLRLPELIRRVRALERALAGEREDGDEGRAAEVAAETVDRQTVGGGGPGDRERILRGKPDDEDEARR